MGISNVGGSSSNVTATSQTLTSHANTQGQDWIFVAQAFNPTTGVTATPTINTVPFTPAFTVNYSTTLRMVVWYKIAAGALGVASTDASSSVVLNNGGVSQQVAGSIRSWRGISGINASAGLTETVAGTSHVIAGATAAAANSVGLFFAAERSTTAPSVGSSINCNAAGQTKWDSSFAASGAGVNGILVAASTVSVANGVTVGGGTWSGFVSNVGFVSAVLSMTPLGPGVTLAATPGVIVPQSTTVSLTATETGVSGTPTRSWTQVSGPSVVLTGSTSITASFSPTVADQYVFQYSVTDSNGTTNQTIQVNVTTTTPGPVALVNAGTSTPVGAGTPTAVGVVTDNDPTTYMLGAAPQTNDPLIYRLAPAALGTGGLTIFYNDSASGVDKTITNTVTVVDATNTSTVLAGPWGDVLTTTDALYSHALSTSELSGISVSQACNLAVKISANAA